MAKEEERRPRTMREHLAKAGTFVAQSEEMQQRIKRRKDFFDSAKAFRHELKGEDGKTLSPEEQLLAIVDKLEDMDNVIKENSVPWGEGGTTKWYAELMKHYEGMMGLIIHDCLIQLTNVRKMGSLLEKRVAVRQVIGFIVRDILRYMKLVEDISWRGPHVTEKTTVVIQAASMESGAGIDLNKEAQKL